MTKKKKKIKELEGTVDEGRVKILRSGLYKKHHYVIRMIGTDYFEYLLEYNGEIYSSYIIIKPRGKKSKLTKDEIDQCSGLIYAGAETTLDALLGEEVDDQTKHYVETFESGRDKVEGEKDNNG